VGLLISDKELREKILYILKSSFKREIKISTDIRGEEYDLVISDSKPVKSPAYKVITVEKELNPKELLNKLEIFLRLPREGKKLIIGIDPGKRIGVAVLCLNDLISWRIFSKGEEVASWLSWVINTLGIKDIKIKVGGGARFREVIETLTKEGLREIKVVDESNTTKELPELKVKELDEEILSAIKIALRL